jgi:hypothetical protein
MNRESQDSVNVRLVMRQDCHLPPESPFVQVDLGASQAFDIVALVPAIVDFQSLTQSAYAFPPRYRLDASDDENFATFTPLKVQLNEDAVLYGAAPVIVHTPSIKARYLRLTVPTMARVEGRWTFALSEIMVLQGNRNIALAAKVLHLKGTNLPPRWLGQNVTDGRTPLGPPMDRSSVPEYDALFAAIHDDVTSALDGCRSGCRKGAGGSQIASAACASGR